jgi:iron complex transport system substrate-binding protein
VRGLVALLLFVLAAPVQAGTVRFTDASGRQISLPQPARRVVTLAPHLAELVFDAGGGSRLVGTVEYTDYPTAARSVKRVGDAFHLDMEELVDLKPDLVLAWASGTPDSALRRLRTLGLTVAVVDSRRLSDIGDNLALLGRVIEGAKRGAQAAAEFRERLARLRRAHAGRPPIRVFYEISATPLYTVGGRHTINDVIRLCGGRNIFADQDAAAPSVSLEAVLARQPQAIVTAGQRGPGSASRLRAWQRWPDLPAVRAGNLFTLPPELIARATPRILDGAHLLCADLDRARQRLAGS